MIEWKKFEEARPYVTVAGFAVDSKGRFPIIYRGPNVRSVKNCWSLPSGLHEVGLTMEQQFCVELGEELNLEADSSRAYKIGTYENILELDRWHWIINNFAVPVKTLDTIVNKEPDKHPEIRIVTFDEAIKANLTWGPNLGKFLQDPEIQARIKFACDLFTAW
jgi:ADP-ribose pyrophosphatase YjhB (NUDIX family)